LEVGTGFHPELTGRENVFLNGSILGMSRSEIARRFDEIVAFSEIEQFLDTPVKRYSSGMYVRLAFAVAAHLEPEILLVDEVLAVGDATYQRRCLQRMSELAASGRTVLVVSHNMDLIPRLCSKAILLERGLITMIGHPEIATRRYLESSLADSEDEDLSGKIRTGDGRARFTRLRVVDHQGRPLLAHASGDDLILEMEIDSKHEIPDVALAIVLKNLQGTRLFSSWTREGDFPVSLRRGRQAFRCIFRHLRLRPGHRINIGLWASCQEVLDSIEDARVVEITDGGSSKGFSTDKYQGIVLCDYVWER
jgi:lipopolysaccharide transport system ATP-binding protein